MSQTSAFPPEHFTVLARVFYSLSTPSRLQLLSLLYRQSSTASEVAKQLETSYANALKQLSILESAGWLHRRKVGSTYYYSLHRRWVLDLVAECGSLLHSKNI
jgi:DNA-binding transcriptional ArsR family regulator